LLYKVAMCQLNDGKRPASGGSQIDKELGWVVQLEGRWLQESKNSLRANFQVLYLSIALCVEFFSYFNVGLEPLRRTARPFLGTDGSTRPVSGF
jgi:hypothetical protein